MTGDRAAVGPLDASSISGLALDVKPPPAPPAAPAAEALVRAEAAYATGDFDTCHRELGKIDPIQLLAQRDRTVAARALLFDAACAWGATDHAGAHAIAARFASFELDLPAVTVSPDVDAVFSSEITAARRASRSPLAVTGRPGAQLSIDGREPGCTLPCALEVAPGTHVVTVDGDGFGTVVEQITAPRAQLVVQPRPATPEQAARQWQARTDRGLRAIDPASARLVSVLAGNERAIVLQGGDRLTGGLVADGALVAMRTGVRGGGSALVRDLAYAGGLLEKPRSIWRRPWIWLAIGGLAIGGTIVAVTYSRPIATSIGF